jgi:hypothetical protein
MKPLRFIYPAATALLLAGCAGSVSEPTAVQSLSPDQKANLHISDVTADAASGVQMSDGDFGLICQKVKEDIRAQTPAVLEAPASGQPLKMNIHFTRFDRGNALARAMLIGMGQIKIEATVVLTDANGTAVGQYEVSKDFALGGIAGATTNVEDVEEGFAKSVVEIVK